MLSIKKIAWKMKMKKLLLKALKIMLIVVTLMTASVCKAGKVKAVQLSEANLYKKSSYGNMLTYNGVEVLTTFVVYQKDGVEYPAYCVDASKPGVGEVGSYTVDTSSLLNDVELWKVVVNGYPYKEPAALGCNTKEEAFTATKQAIYCRIYGRTAEAYGTIGEAGKRVKNAMAQILENAKNTNKYKTEVTLNANKEGFTIDERDKNYMSQVINISSSYAIKKMQIILEGNYPEGTKIVDIQNREITSFVGVSTFKVMYPIQNARQSGSFGLKVLAEVSTYPVLYGRAYDQTRQDYILTGNIIGDTEAYKTLYYGKNETQITIKKIATDTNKPLEGVKFCILDSAKKQVYSELVTDDKGEIILSYLIPGNYYLEEVATKEGYVKYDKLIPFELTLGQSLTVTVNNTREQKIEFTNNEAQITVTPSASQTIINKDSVVINKNENTEVIENNTNIATSNGNTNQIENTVNTNISNNNSNTNINDNNINTNVNNNNSNTNINDNNTNTNVNNNNSNTNINDNNTNTNVSNNNSSTNINNNNTNTNVSSNNSNTNINDNNSNTNVSSNNSNTNINNNNSNININNNIQNINGIVKLPKTGM